MIEAFEAGTMKEQLKHPDIMFDKLVSVDASYGVVLAAEARRLKSCMNRYVKENSPKIFNELAKHTVSFKVEFLTVSIFPRLFQCKEIRFFCYLEIFF